MSKKINIPFADQDLAGRPWHTHKSRLGHSNAEFGGVLRGSVSVIMLLLVIVFIVQNVIGINIGTTGWTFTGLLERLASIKTFDDDGKALFSMSWATSVVQELRIKNDWSINTKLFNINFNFLRDFLNFYVMTPLSVIIFIVSGIINAIVILSQFLVLLWG